MPLVPGVTLEILAQTLGRAHLVPAGRCVLKGMHKIAFLEDFVNKSHFPFSELSR